MIAGVFDEFFGVPTHPLAVHAPVVLVPIFTILAVVLAVRTDWRGRAWWLMPVGVLLMVAMLFVAKESGEAAAESNNVFGDIDEHEDLAEMTFIISLVWFVATVATAVRDRMTRTPTPLSADVAPADRDTAALVLGVLAAVLAILTTIWLIRTGHAGAESRWVI